MSYQYIDEGKKHLHTLDASPLIGTSSVANVLAKPLTWWAAGLAVAKFGWINKKDENGKFRPKAERLAAAVKLFLQIKSMSDEEYLKLLDEAYSAHAKKLDDSASDGIDLHAEVERFVKYCMDAKSSIETFDPKIQPFIDWVEQNVDHFLWSEMHCFSRRLWVGGISDIGFVDKQGRVGVLDIKSSKEAYLSQFWQCAGYGIQIKENGGFDRDGNKIFTLDRPIDYYVVFPFGMKIPTAQYNFDVVDCEEAFECEVCLYKKLNKSTI